MPTAAVLIIGDEILTGKFPDANGPFLIGRLRTLGTDLRRLVVVSDDPDAISDEVARCSAAFDHVITTGGVGPTHDDRTMDGVARAFSLPLELRPELVALLDRYGLAQTETNLQMATVPAGADLVLGPGSTFPIVRVRNVWVFPGVPKLMQVKFESIARHFAAEQVSCVRLYTDQPETDIASLLASVARAHPTVTIGSYPRFGEGNYRVIVTLEARDPPALDQATAALTAGMSLVVPSAVV
ncbi:MAG: molybdopterin-binding protein [Myxococcota bacterium]